MNFIDTHTHLDGEEFDADRDETIQRAKDAGVSKVFIPAIDSAVGKQGACRVRPLSRLCLSDDRTAS